MKRFATALTLLGLLAGLAQAQETETPEKEPAGPSPFKTTKEKVSYGLGINIGRNFSRAGLEVDYDIFLAGLKDALNKADPKLDMQEFEKLLVAYGREMQEKLAEKNKTEGEAFLEKNKKEKGVITTKSGLQYVVLKEGRGESPEKQDTVKTHYRGTLLDGTEFDSSYKRDEPAEFPLDRVIQGWTEALQLMKVGAKYRLFVPSELAYGKSPPQGSPIGPNSVLIFEVELLDVTGKAGKDNKPAKRKKQ